jgi:hypothetical protein
MDVPPRHRAKAGVLEELGGPGADGDPNAQPRVNPDAYPSAIIAEAVTRIEISDGTSEPITHVTGEDVQTLIRDWSEVAAAVVGASLRVPSRMPYRRRPEQRSRRRTDGKVSPSSLSRSAGQEVTWSLGPVLALPVLRPRQAPCGDLQRCENPRSAGGER